MNRLFLFTIILCCFIQIEAYSKGYSYDTICTCLQASPNGTFCWAYRCQTDQMTKCFSSDSTVQIKSTKERKSMKDLQIGDEVLVDVNQQGQYVHKPIYSCKFAWYI
jgi:hypothetical protein